MCKTWGSYEVSLPGALLWGPGRQRERTSMCTGEHVNRDWAAKLARQRAAQQALPGQAVAHSVVGRSARDDSTPNVARGPSARKSNGFCSHCCNLGP